MTKENLDFLAHLFAFIFVVCLISYPILRHLDRKKVGVIQLRTQIVLVMMVLSVLIAGFLSNMLGN